MSQKSIGALSTGLKEIAEKGVLSESSINGINIALETLKEKQIAAIISTSGLEAAQIAAAFKANEMSEAEILAKLSIMGFSKEVAVASVVTDNFTREQAESIIETEGLAFALKTANGAALGFSTTLRGIGVAIKSNLPMLILSVGLALLPKIIDLVKDLYKSSEELIEIGNEAFDLVTEKTEKITGQAKGVDELAESYAKLTAGVDNLTNKNISLSDENYKEYLDISVESDRN